MAFFRIGYTQAETFHTLGEQARAMITFLKSCPIYQDIAETMDRLWLTDAIMGIYQWKTI